MERQRALITVATLAIALLATGCGSSQKESKSKLPTIAADNTPFVRISKIAYRDLLMSERMKRPTPTREVVEAELKRQRVFNRETLDKGDSYIPGLVDLRDPKSIVKIDSGVEKWALIEAAVWDDSRHTAVVVGGLIPLSQYNSAFAGGKGLAQ